MSWPRGPHKIVVAAMRSTMAYAEKLGHRPRSPAWARVGRTTNRRSRGRLRHAATAAAAVPSMARLMPSTVIAPASVSRTGRIMQSAKLPVAFFYEADDVHH